MMDKPPSLLDLLLLFVQLDEQQQEIELRSLKLRLHVLYRNSPCAILRWLFRE